MTRTIALAAALVSLLPAAEKWKPLFNGKDLKDWSVKIRGFVLDDNHANTFRVENGVMKVSYDGYQDFGNRFGHIFYKKRPFSHYRLGVEYRFVGPQCPGGLGWATRNSGAMLHSQDPKTMGKDQDFPISIEVQFLGGLSNGRPRTTANLCTPGTNVERDGKLFTPHCVNSMSATYDGDQWVRVEIEMHGGGDVTHWIDGKPVLTYSKPQIGGGSVSGHDPAVKQDGKILEGGYISLQSESHPVEFRKVEIREFKNCQCQRKAH